MKRTGIIVVFCLFHLLSMAQLPDTDIWLLQLDEGNKGTIPLMQNITKRAGYDNQPCFSQDGSYILYTSIREDKQADIYKYDLLKEKSIQLTRTAESEYSPAFIPGTRGISVVRVEKDSAQRLWKFDAAGTNFSHVNKEVDSVGYYAWLDSASFVAFILTKPSTLQEANTKNSVTKIMADHIGRSMHHVPGKATTYLYYIKHADSAGMIYKMDLKSKTSIPVIKALKNSEDFAIWKNNILLMAQGSILYKFEIGKDADWKQLAELPVTAGIKKITRIAVSPDNKKIALAAE